MSQVGSIEEFTFLAVPKNILRMTEINLTDKVIYSMLLGFQANGDSWASNDYIAKSCGVTSRTVARSLDTLEEFGLIDRSTKQTGPTSRRRTIKTIRVSDKMSLTNKSECQNVTQSVTKCHSGECQNVTILDNTYNINEERAHTPELLFKLTEEIQPGSGRLQVENFPHLALNLSEAKMVNELLIKLKFETKSQIELIFITASSIAEGSESRKAISKSFSYIRLAFDDLLKTRKNHKELQYSENKNSKYLPQNNDRSRHAERKIIKSQR